MWYWYQRCIKQHKSQPPLSTHTRKNYTTITNSHNAHRLIIYYNKLQKTQTPCPQTTNTHTYHWTPYLASADTNTHNIVRKILVWKERKSLNTPTGIFMHNDPKRTSQVGTITLLHLSCLWCEKGQRLYLASTLRAYLQKTHITTHALQMQEPHPNLIHDRAQVKDGVKGSKPENIRRALLKSNYNSVHINNYKNNNKKKHNLSCLRISQSTNTHTKSTSN